MRFGEEEIKAVFSILFFATIFGCLFTCCYQCGQKPVALIIGVVSALLILLVVI